MIKMTRAKASQTKNSLGAEQWMMLGVVALGGLAVYFLTRAKTSPTPDTETPILKPSPSTAPGPAALGPATASPPNPGPFLQDRPRGELLKPGQAFRGRLDIGPTPEADLPLSPASSRGDITRFLQGLGFTKVEVAMSPEEAAPRVLLQQPLAQPNMGTRWFTAEWPSSPAGKTFVRPRRMTYLWFVT